MTLSQDLAGRTAVVTGGASGLGRAIALRLSTAGASVTIIDLATAQDQCPQEFKFLPCDVGECEAKVQLAQLAGELGAVDILVANAGVVPPWRGLRDVDGAEWQRVMAINTWGVAASIGGFADVMSKSECASVVVMASINGFRAHPQQVLYTASKHAAIGITRAAALDLGPKGIRVNALAPGPIATDALLGRISDRHEAGGPDPEVVMHAMEAETALGRIATAEDVANAAHFLASDASSGMTGSIFPVEAGLA